MSSTVVVEGVIRTMHRACPGQMRGSPKTPRWRSCGRSRS